MIWRVGSTLLLIYALGFVLFAFTLETPLPPDAPKSDAAIVLTGGSGRIEHAIDVLKKGKVKRVLVSGADPVVAKADLVKRLGKGSKKWFDCCVDLDSVSVDTRTNAEEADRWMREHRFTSLRLITSDYHMRRSRYEFEKLLKGRYRITSDAIRTEPTLLTLYAEYNKYLLRRVGLLVGI